MSAALKPLEPPPFDAEALRAALGATEAQMAELERFRVLLGEWNAVMNLVGPSAMANFWERHAYDSAQLLALAPEAKTWADLGAGAGFPGIVLAILLKDVEGAHVHLIDSQAKRCKFLSAVVEALALPATVHHARAEDLALKVDVAAARACAPMVKLLGYALPYLKRGATGLFLKGQDVVAEMSEAAKCWNYQVQLLPSRSDPGGRVVQISRLVRARNV